MKPVVLARENDAMEEDVRDGDKHHDTGQQDEGERGEDSAKQNDDSINVNQRERNEGAIEETARCKIRVLTRRVDAMAKIELKREDAKKNDAGEEAERGNGHGLSLKKELAGWSESGHQRHAEEKHR